MKTCARSMYISSDCVTTSHLYFRSHFVDGESIDRELQQQTTDMIGQKITLVQPRPPRPNISARTAGLP